MPATPAQLEAAVQALRAGHVVAYPTEALYALAVDIRRVDAVEKLRAIKAREAHKPLAILVADPLDIHALVKDVSPAAQQLMRLFWPGPLTLIFNAAPGLPEGLTAQTSTVAVRCSSHPVARALAAGGAITATGCNKGGGRSVRTAAEIDPELRAALAMVVEGAPEPGGLLCSVVDARLGTPSLVREGAIARATLEASWA
jgi:L-threonylcarbamoyladenylate synthase